jgi:uncharacterized membrane protein
VAFANPIPWWALVLVLAAAAGLSWHAYRGFASWPVRRYILSSLRFVTLVAIVLVLMRPVSRLSEADSRDTVVPILVDTSRSMGIEDADGSRRIDRVRAFLAESLVPALAGRFTVEVLAFGEGLAPSAPDALAATARRTDIGGALTEAREMYRGRPVAGYVLITDGADTGAELDPEQYAETLPPVYPLPVGSADLGQDREVVSVTAAESVLAESRVDLAVSAIAHGSSDASVELRLLENGRLLQVRHVRPPADGGPLREVFQVSPSTGAATVYSVEIPPAAGELVPENNTRSVIVQPPSRPRRILMIEGAPGYEHSFIRRALAADPGLEVDTVVRKGKDEKGNDTFYIQAARSRGESLTSGYPLSPAALFAYDALILANVGGEQLTGAQMDATREFVSRRGGGLLVMGAQSFLGRGLVGTPIETALPVEISRRVETASQGSAGRGTNRVALSDAGVLHPVTQLAPAAEDNRKRWTDLPPLAAAASLGAAKPGAAILATTAGSGGVSRPLIAVQRYGAGRSMVFAGEASWRWRMMLPSSDRTFETFWRQAVRWLVIGATDPLTLLPAPPAAPGDEFAIRAAVRTAEFTPLPEAVVDMRIVGPDGKVHERRAGVDASRGGDPAVYSAPFTAESPGIYRATVTAHAGTGGPESATASLLVGGADEEMTDPRVNTAYLERVAAASGGRVHPMDDAAALVASLEAGAPAALLAVQKDLWHNAWSLLLIIGLLAAEWILRRRWGLR